MALLAALAARSFALKCSVASLAAVVALDLVLAASAATAATTYDASYAPTTASTALVTTATISTAWSAPQRSGILVGFVGTLVAVVVVNGGLDELEWVPQRSFCLLLEVDATQESSRSQPS